MILPKKYCFQNIKIKLNSTTWKTSLGRQDPHSTASDATAAPSRRHRAATVTAVFLQNSGKTDVSAVLPIVVALP